MVLINNSQCLVLIYSTRLSLPDVFNILPFYHRLHYVTNKTNLSAQCHRIVTKTVTSA